MMQSRNIVVVGIALVVGFGAGFVTRSIIAPADQVAAVSTSRLSMPSDAPRAVQYFAAHLDDAQRIVAECQSGSVRGNECSNASQAVTEAAGKERFRKFVGN